MPHDVRTAATVCGLARRRARPTRRPAARPTPSRRGGLTPGPVRSPLTPATAAFDQFARCFAAGRAAARAAARATRCRRSPTTARRPQRPADLDEHRRARHRGAAPPRHHARRRRPARLGRRPAADRRPGRTPTATPDSTGRGSPRPRRGSTSALRRAHAALPIDLDDPRVWAAPRDQRRALARRAGLADHQAERPRRAGAARPRPLRRRRPALLGRSPRRAGSRSPTSSSDRSSTSSGRSALLVVPAPLRDGWQLVPALSLRRVRLLAALGGRLERGLRGATLPLDAIDALLERVNQHTLHAGGRECLDSGRRLGEALTRVLERPCTPGAPRDPRDRWGRLLVSRATHTGPDGTRRGELHLRVLTFAARGYSQRRLGSAPRDQYPQPSASMDLGEAVQTAVDRGLPLLLCDRGRRAPRRPGPRRAHEGPPRHAHHHHRRRPQRHHAARRRRTGAPRAAPRSRPTDAPVVLDAGARQVLRMVRARPLADDPVLLGRQRERRRAEGRRLRRRRLRHRRRQDRHQRPRPRPPRRHHPAPARARRRRGPPARPMARRAHASARPGRGLPALAPNVDVLVLDDAAPARRPDPRLRPRARRARRRRAVPQRRARPLPRPTRSDPLAPADRRRGAALRQPRHPRPPGAQARPARQLPPTAGC